MKTLNANKIDTCHKTDGRYGQITVTDTTTIPPLHDTI